MRGFPKNQIGLFAAAIWLAAAFFALDLALPLGVAGGVPYMALVLLGWWLDRPRYLVLLGAVSTALTIAGYYFSAAGGIEWMALTNRALAFFAIWTTVGLLAKVKNSEIALQDSRDELEQQAEALRSVITSPTGTARSGATKTARPQAAPNRPQGRISG